MLRISVGSLAHADRELLVFQTEKETQTVPFFSNNK